MKDTTDVEAVNDQQDVRLQQLDEMNAAMIVLMDKDGNPFYPANVTNLATMMRLHPDWRDVLAYDMFQRTPMLTQPIPGSPEDSGAPFKGRRLQDTDYTWARMWFERCGVSTFMKAKKQDVTDALDAAIRQVTADPLLQYLVEAEAAWDGERRIEYLFRDYFIADQFNTYTRELGEKMLMTLVMRGLEPGAFQKMMPIFEGDQDIGKSSGLRALCPDDDWFGDAMPSALHSQNASVYLRGKFLIEMSELAPTRRAEMEDLKAFLTRKIEDFRPPYGRNNVTEPRRCMFIGTTNQSTYLRDETGNTRLYPVKLVSVDKAAIIRDRQQLLGEAVVAYREAIEAGEAWWEFSAEAQAELDRERKEKAEDDPWLSVVSNFIESLDQVCPREILTRHVNAPRPGLGLDVGNLTKTDGNRVAGLLRQLGWVKCGQITSGEYKAQGRFVPKEREKELKRC